MESGCLHSSASYEGTTAVQCSANHLSIAGIWQSAESAQQGSGMLPLALSSVRRVPDDSRFQYPFSIMLVVTENAHVCKAKTFIRYQTEVVLDSYMRITSDDEHLQEIHLP